MKNVLRLLVACAALTSSLHAVAQTAGQTTIVVPFPAGGSLDVLARITAQKLAEQTKEAYIVDNRPGANGIIGAKLVAKSKPDGKTWLFSDGAAMTVNPFLYPRDPDFSAEKDLRVVRALAFQPLVLVVNAKSSAKTLREFVDSTRKGDVNYASAGVGSSSHLTMAYFGSQAGNLKLTHVPYKGGPQVLNALVAGEVDAGFIVLPNVLPYIKQGVLRPLAVSSAQRSTYLPDVPTMIELGYTGFEVENRHFAWLPSGTPDDIVKKVNAALAAALADPAVVEKFSAAYLEPASEGDAQSRQWLIADRDKWAKVIRDHQIKAD